MDDGKGGGTGTKILTAAIIIALLAVAFGAYEGLQPRSNASIITVTRTSTVGGPTTTITGGIVGTNVTTTMNVTTTITGANVTTTKTVTSTTAVVVTIPGGPVQAKESTIAVGDATSNPQGMAFNPTDNKIYVALDNSSSVAVINAVTHAVITTIPLAPGDMPIALAYDSANDMVYVANSNSSTISVINGATDTLASTISVPDTTNGIAVNPTTNTVFLTSNDDDAMFFINGATSDVSVLQVHGGIPDNAQAVAVDTSNGMAFVANWYHTRTAAEFGFVGNQSNGGCLATNTNSSFCITKSLTLTGGRIDGIAVNPNTGLIYVANVKADVVNVISESTGTDIANITVPSPVGVNVDLHTNLVYVASNETGMSSLIVISGSTNSILASIPVGNGPANVALDADTNTIYVSNADDGTISVIDGASLLS